MTNPDLPKACCRDFLHLKLDEALKLLEAPGDPREELGPILADMSRCSKSWESVPEFAVTELRNLMALIEELRGSQCYAKALMAMSDRGFEQLRQQMVQTFWLIMASLDQLNGPVGQD
jgi:hypothetical protein